MAALRTVDRLSLLLVAVTALAGVALVPSLPAEVAIHFSAGGTPDNYVPRAAAVLLLPAIALATVAIVRGAAAADSTQDVRSIDAVVLGVTALLCGVHLLVLAWNLGYAIPMSLVALVAVCIALGIAGYAVLREGP